VEAGIWQVILGAHVLHLLLLGDFGYYYVKHLDSFADRATSPADMLSEKLC
jgi:hypothetical protein